MVEGADEADGDDGDAELLGEAEAAFFEVVEVAIAGALRFGKDNEADAAVDGFLGEAPEAFQILGTAHAGHGNVAEALHQPAVNRDAEMRFQFPAADKLRNGAIKDEGIEEIDVVDHEERRAGAVEAGGFLDDYFCAGEKSDAAAEATLEIVVLARVENDGEADEYGDNDQEVKPAHAPEKCAAQDLPETLHT